MSITRLTALMVFVTHSGTVVQERNIEVLIGHINTTSSQFWLVSLAHHAAFIACPNC